MVPQARMVSLRARNSTALVPRLPVTPTALPWEIRMRSARAPVASVTPACSAGRRKAPEAVLRSPSLTAEGVYPIRSSSLSLMSSARVHPSISPAANTRPASSSSVPVADTLKRPAAPRVGDGPSSWSSIARYAAWKLSRARQREPACLASASKSGRAPRL